MSFVSIEMDIHTKKRDTQRNSSDNRESVERGRTGLHTPLNRRFNSHDATHRRPGWHQANNDHPFGRPNRRRTHQRSVREDGSVVHEIDEPNGSTLLTIESPNGHQESWYTHPDGKTHLRTSEPTPDGGGRQYIRDGHGDETWIESTFNSKTGTHRTTTTYPDGRTESIDERTVVRPDGSTLHETIDATNTKTTELIVPTNVLQPHLASRRHRRSAEVDDDPGRTRPPGDRARGLGTRSTLSGPTSIWMACSRATSNDAEGNTIRTVRYRRTAV